MKSLPVAVAEVDEISYLSRITYLVVSFDRLEFNLVPKMAQDVVAALFPGHRPDYMERAPFSYGDPTLIESDLVSAGFKNI